MTADPMTPTEAIARSGPQPALCPETWLDEHGSALYRYALLRLRDPHKAEDAVQETLLAALAARERFTGGASVRTWLTGILKRKVMDQFRHDLREVELEDPDELTEGADGDGGEDFDPSGRWRERLAHWGDPVAEAERTEVLGALLDRLPIAGVWSHGETGNGWTYRRDLAVGRLLTERGGPWHELPQNGVVRGLAGRDPWSREWERRMTAPLTPGPGLVGVGAGIEPGEIRSDQELGLAADPRPLRLRGAGARRPRPWKDSSPPAASATAARCRAR